MLLIRITKGIIFVLVYGSFSFFPFSGFHALFKFLQFCLLSCESGPSGI